MAHDARILQHRVGALEDVVVGAADADVADGDPDPPGFQFRASDVDVSKLAGFVADNSAHSIFSARDHSRSLAARNDHLSAMTTFTRFPEGSLTSIPPPVSANSKGWWVRRERTSSSVSS